ncbi:M48 family metallopeptidase [Thermodesulfobacteriota bacterium]
MAAVLLGLGYVIGFALDPRAGFIGLAVAACIWGIMAVISLSSGDQILLRTSKAVPVTKDVHPMLFNVVEEMTIAAGLSKMPKIYIIIDPAPNAFATGRKPESASVAVTAGLLARLNRDELQGVIAHEMSHIIHRDILYVTVAGIMLGTIVLLSHMFLRGMFYSSLGGSSRRFSSGREGGSQLQVIMIAVAVLAAILAPIMTYLLYFALSRRREYLADAGGARLTRYPEGLASALEKIASDPSPQLGVANKATAPMYIANPFKRKGQSKLADLTSTHPPISERVKILRNMSGASFSDYSGSFARITGTASVIPLSVEQDKAAIPLRQSDTAPSAPATKKQQHLQVGDLMRKVNGFSFLTCPCGLKLKIPPNFKAPKVKCPRCERILDVKSPV